MFSDNDSSIFTVDKIIEKMIPVIGGIFFIVGFGYLLYTNIWANLILEIQLSLGFFLSFAIIGGAISFTNKLKYFADIIIGLGILLFYGTLIFGSRTTEMAVALIPEIVTLITSFFSMLLFAYFVSKRKSKTILIISMIGAYITPFVIGQHDVWVQNISFNAYLIYFMSVNIVAFFTAREFALRDIVPLNIIGLFIGIQTMYKVSVLERINHTSQSFFTSEIFSAILLFMIAIFFLWSIVISSKYFEKDDEGYVTFSYVSIIFWFIYNLGHLDSISSEVTSIFYIIFSAILFYAWHNLRSAKTQYQHVSLYSGAVLCATIAFLQLIPELNIYSSIIIAYSSVIFGVLYYIDSTKTERLFTYGFLSLLGALLSIVLVYDSEIVLRFSKTIYVVLALIPAMFGYFLSQKSKNDKYIEISKMTSITAGFIASMFIFVDIIEYLDYGLILFYILPLISLIYIRFSKDVFDDTIQLVLRFSIVVMLIGYIGIFLSLLGNIQQPIDIGFFTNYNYLSDVILLKGTLATVIFFLGLSVSRDLQTRDIESRPSFILVLLGYTNILLIVNYILIAILNDFNMQSISVLVSTIWWVILAVIMLYIGMKRSVAFHSEKMIGFVLCLITLLKITLYDISSMQMENKIVLLMMVGGTLMIFSYVMHTKGLLKSNDPK